MTTSRLCCNIKKHSDLFAKTKLVALVLLPALFTPASTLACCRQGTGEASSKPHCAMMSERDMQLEVTARLIPSPCCQVAVPPRNSPAVPQSRTKFQAAITPPNTSFSFDIPRPKISSSPPRMVAEVFPQRVQAILCSFLV